MILEQLMPNSSTHEIVFHDRRPPYEIQFVLERDIRALFTNHWNGTELYSTAHASIVGAQYDFCLRFVAALSFTNCYSLTVEVSWPAQTVSKSGLLHQDVGKLV